MFIYTTVYLQFIYTTCYIKLKIISTLYIYIYIKTENCKIDIILYLCVEHFTSTVSSAYPKISNENKRQGVKLFICVYIFERNVF